MPEANEPDIWPVNSRKESLCDWQVPNLRSFEVTWKMCKAYPEEGCNLVMLSIGSLPQQLQYWLTASGQTYRISIVREESTDLGREEDRPSYLLQQVYCQTEKYANDASHEPIRGPVIVEVYCKFFASFD